MKVTFIGKVVNNEIVYEDQEAYKIWLGQFPDTQLEIVIKPHKDRRTLTQNSALHLFFTQLADAFNNAGLDMKKVLKEDAEISWTTENVKNYLWRPIQEALIHKFSTTELDKVQDINRTYEELNRHISTKFGISVQFPSLSTQFKQINNE